MFRVGRRDDPGSRRHQRGGGSRRRGGGRSNNRRTDGIGNDRRRQRQNRRNTTSDAAETAVAAAGSQSLASAVVELPGEADTIEQYEQRGNIPFGGGYHLEIEELKSEAESEAESDGEEDEFVTTEDRRHNRFESLMADDESSSDGSMPLLQSRAERTSSSDSDCGDEEEEDEVATTGDSRHNRFESLMTDDESSSDGSMPLLQSRAEHTSSSDSDCGSDDTCSSSDGSVSELNSRVEGTLSFDSDRFSVFDDDSTVGQEDTARCAVCFMKDDQQDNWRRLMTLPCCGVDGKERSSSTRFCAACILRMAQTEKDPISSNELPHDDDDRRNGPAKKFYGRLNIQTNARRCIECPRCRDIMIVNIKNPASKRHRRRQQRLGTDWTVPTTADSVSLAQPSFSERVRYAGRQRGYAYTLFNASLLHHSFLPRQLIGDESMCARLVQ